ncbi:DNA cytosine methyltransferase [Streptomyces avidinii]|uniref:DNA cytosine methyltransferase n=1 Tax=Streptomyces avidinii TaxID=1895 RepID=UPI00386F4DE5|nr:DNA cytosine methyltransferase [Streptomyces avidinii]
MDLRIGSLFSGTGQLDEAVRAVFGGEVAWHSQYEPPKDGKEDTNQYAAKILARHYPTVPNLGDITRVDWQQATADHGPIDILTGGFPCQDVSSAGKRAGLTADSRSGLWAHMARAIHELQPRLVVIENVQGLLSAEADRGLGSDLEDLEEEASASWILRALGAVLGDLATLGFDAEWCRAAASEVGAPHPRKRVFILAWPAAVDAGRLGRRDGQGILGRLGPAGRGPEAATDAADLGHERGGAARRRRPGPADSDLTAADTDRGRQREAVLELRPGQPHLDWGDYGPAIRRWEAVLGRPAPWPTDALGRLNPEFSEWMLGWPDGWVVDTPGLTRGAMLRAIGNGVCPQQAEAAIRLLAARASTTAAAA